MEPEDNAVIHGDGDSTPSELDILGDDPVKEKEVPDPEVKEKETPDPDPEEEPLPDLDDEEIKDPEKNPEEEEVPEVNAKVNLKEINQKYPKLFKEYPHLRGALAREKAYSDILPTIDDAKEASQKAQVFDFLEETLTSGNVEPLITNLKNTKSLDKFADNLLPEILKQDPQVHLKITLPIIKKVLRMAFSEGTSAGNKNLSLSAQHLTQYLFGTPNVTVLNEEKKEEVKEDPEKQDLKNRLNQHVIQQESKFVNEIRTGVESAIKKEVNIFISSLDKEKKLTPFVREAIADRVIQAIDYKLTRDEGHIRKMTSLREKAARSNFAGDWKSRVISAYLEGAKNLQISYQRQLVAKALGNEVVAGKKTIPQTSGSGSAKAVPLDPKKVFTKDPKTRMTDLEFLAAD